MSILKHKSSKEFGIRRFTNSIKYSLAGFKSAYKDEQSLWIHAAGTITGIVLGFIFKISFTECISFIITSLIVLCVELLNTAIESTVDLVTSEIHPLAKRAKDLGSAAACIAGFVFAGTMIYIFLPYFLDLLK